MCVCGGGGNGLFSNSVCIEKGLVYKAYTLQRYIFSGARVLKVA